MSCEDYEPEDEIVALTANVDALAAAFQQVLLWAMLFNASGE